MAAAASDAKASDLGLDAGTAAAIVDAGGVLPPPPSDMSLDSVTILTVSPPDIRFDGELMCRIEVAPGVECSREAWVAIRPVVGDDGSELGEGEFAWTYVCDRLTVDPADGTAFTEITYGVNKGPGFVPTAGNFCFVFYLDSSRKEFKRTEPFRVLPICDMMVQDMACFPVDVDVTFFGLEAIGPKDWVGCYPVNAAVPSIHGACSGLWYWASSLEALDGGGHSIKFNIASYLPGPGTYVFRYHMANNYMVAAQSNPVTFYSNKEMVVQPQVFIGDPVQVLISEAKFEAYDYVALHRVGSEGLVDSEEAGARVFMRSSTPTGEGRVLNLPVGRGAPGTTGTFVYRYHITQTASKAPRFSCESNVFEVKSEYAVTAPDRVVESEDGTRIVRVVVAYPPSVDAPRPADSLNLFRPNAKKADLIEFANEAPRVSADGEPLEIEFTLLLPSLGTYWLHFNLDGDVEAASTNFECVGVYSLEVGRSSRDDGRFQLPEPLQLTVFPTESSLRLDTSAWVGVFAPDIHPDKVFKPTYWQAIPSTAEAASGPDGKFNLVFAEYPNASVSYELRMYEEGTDRLLGCSAEVFFAEDEVLTAKRREEARVAKLAELEAFHDSLAAAVAAGETAVEPMPSLSDDILNTHINNAGNTCYLDASLMAMFAGTTVYDFMVLPDQSVASGDNAAGTGAAGGARSAVSTSVVEAKHQPLQYFLRGVIQSIRRGETIDKDVMEQLRFLLRKSGWEADDIREDGGRMQFGGHARQQDARELVQNLQDILACPWLVSRPVLRHLRADGSVVRESERGMEQIAAIMLSIPEVDYAVPLQSLFDAYFVNELEGYTPTPAGGEDNGGDGSGAAEEDEAVRFVMGYNLLGECPSSSFTDIMKAEMQRTKRSFIADNNSGGGSSSLSPGPAAASPSGAAAAGSAGSPSAFPRVSIESLAMEEPPLTPQASEGLDRVLTPPSNITIVLKRFGNDLTKIETEVNVEEYLDPTGLGDALRGRPEGSRLRLISAVCHTGHRVNSGHYYAFFRRGEDWYRFDDLSFPNIELCPRGIVIRTEEDMTEPTEDMTRLFQESYVLFYEVVGPE